jgi:hypothetical protein
MLASIMYKEWLKIRWTYLVASIIGMFVVLEIFLNLGQIIEFNKANSVWTYIIFQKYLFYNNFQFLPALIGLLIGIAQYFPEVQEKRLKLHLHLPLQENSLLLSMVAVGTVLLIALYLFLVITLGLVTLYFFPREFLFSEIKTIMPWIAAGFAVYFTVAAAFVEISWRRRIIIALTSFSYISMLYYYLGYNSFNKAIPVFLIITIVLSLLIILSGYRFKRGTK